jgi:Restriction alleviation protein Lar
MIDTIDDFFFDSEPELLPCPFCGAVSIKISVESKPDKLFHRWEISCLECSATIHRLGAATKESCLQDERLLVADWNRRAIARLPLALDRKELKIIAKIGGDWLGLIGVPARSRVSIEKSLILILKKIRGALSALNEEGAK